MNFLPYLVYWLISEDISGKLHSCGNDTSGEVGYCLSEWLCSGVAKGINIGSCKNEHSSDICCKIHLHLHYSHSRTPSNLTKTLMPVNAESRFSVVNDMQGTKSPIRLGVEDWKGNSHKVRLFVKRDIFNASRVLMGKDMRKPKKTNAAQYTRQLVEIDNSHDTGLNIQGDIFNQLRFQVKRETSLYMRSPVETDPTHNMRHPVDTDPTHNMRSPVETDPTHNMRRLVETDATHNMRHPVETDATHDMRRPVEIDDSHDPRRPVETDATHDMRRPVETDATHDLRRPVETDATHDMRRPVETDATHDLRRRVETDATHDMRRPVEIDATHDMRRPVEADHTHDMRQPVQIEESHDLRWPVLEEETHDLRNTLHQIDLFRSGLLESDIFEIIDNYKKLKARFNPRNSKKYNYRLEKDFTKCTKAILNENQISGNFYFIHRNPEMKSVLGTRKVSNKECGKLSSQKSGGENERTPEKWPWLVSLQEYFHAGYWHKCGGSLISNLWVVTAAHCVDQQETWEFILRLGNYDTKHDGGPLDFVERYLEEIVIHPLFNRAIFEHDIALLKMELPVEFTSNIFPICLPWNVGHLEGKAAVVLGWKKLGSGKTLYSLFQASIPLLMNNECELLFSKQGLKELVLEDFLCAGNEDESYEICDGDSGGPLVIPDDYGRWSLIGLISWSNACLSSNRPRVYIRVSRYARWIEDTTACFES